MTKALECSAHVVFFAQMKSVGNKNLSGSVIIIPIRLADKKNACYSMKKRTLLSFCDENPTTGQ